MTPGTHPASVSRKTMSTEPHPLSTTARGGKMMHSRTLKNDIVFHLSNKAGKNSGLLLNDVTLPICFMKQDWEEFSYFACLPDLQ